MRHPLHVCPEATMVMLASATRQQQPSRKKIANFVGSFLLFSLLGILISWDTVRDSHIQLMDASMLQVALLPSTSSTFSRYCHPVISPQASPHAAARRSVPSGLSGSMLFDFGAFGREAFVQKTINEYVKEEVPKGFRALEWEPPDGRSTRYLNEDKRHNLITWTAAGEYEGDLAEAKKKQFYTIGGLEKDVKVRFKHFVPNKPLGLQRGSLDIALLQTGATGRLKSIFGAKAYHQIFRETARLLKQRSRFLMFTEVGEELPDIADNYFSVEETLGGDDVGQICYVLARRDQQRSTLRTERKVEKVGKTNVPPPRKIQPSKATARKKDADDSWDDDDDGISAQDIRDALL